MSLLIPFLSQHNRDIRLDRTHEVLSEVKGLRMIGWDGIAYDAIDEARVKEMKVRKFRMYIHGISWGISDNMSKLSSDKNYILRYDNAVPLELNNSCAVATAFFKR